MAADPIPQVDSSVVPRFAGVRTFARLPTLDQAGRADVGILGAPFDGGTTFRAGARFGPAAIREASLLLRPYNDALALSPFSERQVVDAGDAGPNPVDIIQAHRSIETDAASLHQTGARVLGLGGDHSVSLPLLRAAAATHGRLSLLQLDAHTDTWDSYFGSKLTHGTMFRRAVEEELIDAHSSVQIGLRGSLYGPDDSAENEKLGFTTLLARTSIAPGSKEPSGWRSRSSDHPCTSRSTSTVWTLRSRREPEPRRQEGSRVGNYWRSCMVWPRG